MLPERLQNKLVLDHLKLISAILSDGIIIPAKTVRSSASSAAIYLPKKYVGYTFKIILLPETEQDKELFKKHNAIIERDAKIAQMTKQMKNLQTRIANKLKEQETVKTQPAEIGESEDDF